MTNTTMRSLWLTTSLLLGSTVGFAQDNLVNSLKNNQSENSATSFKFTPVINTEATSVKNQKSSGTCWSYSTNSF
ncbi:hypothetical protein [Pedobacter panaciterrae]